jgi:cytoskeletal protein CcmA (bactofilin family)
MDNDILAKNLSWHSSSAEPNPTHTRRDTPEPEPEPTASRPARDLSVLGQTLVFKGELFANEDLLIQGRVEGTITHRAQNLTIGANGDVKADITAQRVIVQGKVRGNIRASESIVLEPSAQVVGNLVAARIGLKEGAKFKGHIDMGEDVDSADDPTHVREKASQHGEAKRESAKRKSAPTVAETGVDELLK